MRKVSILLAVLLFFSLVPYSSSQESFEVSEIGFRLVSWNLDGQNIIDAGERGAMGKSYPLWDWLLNEPWPGSLATNKYEIQREGNKVIGTTKVGDVLVEKTFEVLNKNKAKLTVKLTNEGEDVFRSEVNWDGFSLGYTMAWAGYLGKPGGEKQIWIDETLHIENKNWVRIGTKVKAFGLIDFDEDLIALIFPKEENTALWLESSGWGLETRAEFETLELRPKESKTFEFEIFIGEIEDLKLSYPEIYKSLKPQITKENYKISFETPDFPIEGEQIQVKVKLTPKEPVEGSGTLKAQLSCGESKEIKVPLNQESEIALKGKAQKGCKVSASLEINGKIISSAKKMLSVFTKGEKPLYVVFIWHHHQSPGVFPNGTLHGPWALIHTYEDELKPYYPGGAYYVHAYLLEKYPQIKMTYHLSPSLLWQWNLTNSQWCQSYPKYQCFDKNSEEAKKVQEAMKLYKDLYSKGQIEILSSYFAHPISGYIAEKYGWFDLLDYELSLGINTTKEVLGVQAKGLWLPEMAFSPKLISLLEKHNVKYFALDDQCHLKVIYPYSPYHLYKIENSSMLVLFRDHRLSDDFAFNNNFRSEERAKAKAKEIVEKILSVREKDPNAEVVTIAADGENWMIFSNNPPLTGVYFEALLQYLSEAQEKGLIKTVTFEEITKELRPYKEITPLQTSWLCSWDKWTRERKAKQEPMWKKDEEVYALIQKYKQKCGEDKVYYKALYGFAQAMDSDFYWAEFIFDKHVYAWLDWTENLVKENLEKCKIEQTTKVSETKTETPTTQKEKAICGPGAIIGVALLSLLILRRRR